MGLVTKHWQKGLFTLTAHGIFLIKACKFYWNWLHASCGFLAMIFSLCNVRPSQFSLQSYKNVSFIGTGVAMHCTVQDWWNCCLSTHYLSFQREVCTFQRLRLMSCCDAAFAMAFLPCLVRHNFLSTPTLHSYVEGSKLGLFCMWSSITDLFSLTFSSLKTVSFTCIGSM
jgi:hypothetical protein